MRRPFLFRRASAALAGKREPGSDRLVFMLLAAAATGALGALSTVAFREALELIQAQPSGHEAQGMVSLARGTRPGGSGWRCRPPAACWRA